MLVLTFRLKQMYIIVSRNVLVFYFFVITNNQDRNSFVINTKSAILVS